MSIPKFERKVTHFNGGDSPRHANDLMGRSDYEDACDVAILRCVRADEDLWQVQVIGAGETGRFLAYGDDMHPHPEAPATNIEFLTHLMEWGQTAFTQAFIIEAARRYAEQVLADEAETRKQMENHLISPDLMISTAREVRDYLAARI